MGEWGFTGSCLGPGSLGIGLGVLLTPFPCDFEPVHPPAVASTSWLQDPSKMGLLSTNLIAVFVSKTGLHIAGMVLK